MDDLQESNGRAGDNRTGGPSRIWHVAIVVAVATAAGCASTPTLERDFAITETAISEAKEVNAARYASEELVQAQTKLNAARDALDDGDAEEALTLLREAEALAEYAEAKARTAEARVALEEINKSMEALNEELQRQQPGQTTDPVTGSPVWSGE